MHLSASLLVLQAIAQGGQMPVLEFPEPGLDDPVAYEGYRTRFYRDALDNAFQIYIDGDDGRVVHVWADASNASVAFTTRSPEGEPVGLAWSSPGAEAGLDGARRSMTYRLSSEADALEVGRLVLGTMRKERDVQYMGWHRRPFGEPFVLPELEDLIDSLGRLPPSVRTEHLELLGAGDIAELEARLRPEVALAEEGGHWTFRATHWSLDGRNRMGLVIRGGEGSVASLAGPVLSIRASRGRPIELEVTVSTDHAALEPIGRDRILNDVFQSTYARMERAADSLRRALPAGARDGDPRLAAFRRFERQIRALDLLASAEKLQASLPNYATYFGRDMMMTALMLEPIVSVAVQEQVISAVLSKLGPDGDVSHEEALGGQAIREGAAEYVAEIRAWEEARTGDPAAQRHLARAREIVSDLQAVRENYHMIDDDFQLPVLAARYLSRRDVPSERKRRFLQASLPNGTTRLEALLANLSLVAELARPYAQRPVPTNLVGFTRPDPEGGWYPGSWRDSRAGYGNGRFAMDVNVVWVPEGLEALRLILDAVEMVGLSAVDALGGVGRSTTGLRALLQDPDHLDATVATWRGARHHFEVALEPRTIETRLRSYLGDLEEPSRTYWRDQFASAPPETKGAMSFLALALDENGEPIPAPSTDVATDLFLGDYTERVLRGDLDPEKVQDMLDAFLRPYPIGLFVDRLGPVVVNDAYTSPAVQRAFRDDPYHSPSVVWGREVNLLVLGLARQIDTAYGPDGRLRVDTGPVRRYVTALHVALEVIQEAVEASGLRHNELWSYRIQDGRLSPARYGVSSDIQLWNVTDLAVRFVLDRLPDA